MATKDQATKGQAAPSKEPQGSSGGQAVPVIEFDKDRVFVVRARCKSKKPMIRDGFSYEFGQPLVTKLQAVWSPRQTAQILAAFRAKGGQEPLTPLEFCKAIAPQSMEVLEIKSDESGLPKPISEQITNPPVPGQTGFNEMPKVERIRQYCQTLDHGKEFHWNHDGKPSKLIVSELMGCPVSDDEIAAAVPNLRRRKV